MLKKIHYVFRRGSLALLAICVCAPHAFSQTVSAGLKIGVPLTDFFEVNSITGAAGNNTTYRTSTRRYVFGVSAEARKNAMGIEFDALYHRMSYGSAVSTFNPINGAFSRRELTVAGNTWE